MSALLSLRGVVARYGESTAVDGIDLEVHPGEVVSLLGPNGAGKTTTMGVITGLLACAGGSISFDGADLLRLPPHQRVAAGIALCPEGRLVFPNLTVEENLLLGSFHRGARAARARTLSEMFALFPILQQRRRQPAGLMSGGEQQMLAIARALMARPRLLLLDEPSLGLAPRIVLQLFETIRRIAASRIAILLVEQNARAALGVASRGYVISAGRIVLHDTAAALLASRRMQEAFIGKAARNA
jgi:branched-chain amino acid transport system ATP-binding protein